MDRTTRLKIYAAAIGAIFVALGLTLWLPGIVLWQTGELWPAESIVSQQRKHQGLWSTGLLQNEEEYKQSLFDQSPADITAIGSSRILQLRKHMFAEPFVNMGRGLEMLRIDEELPELIRDKKPKLILWGLDYWHFGKSRADEQLGYKIRQRKNSRGGGIGKSDARYFSAADPFNLGLDRQGRAQARLGKSRHRLTAISRLPHGPSCCPHQSRRIRLRWFAL